ncbi:MAG: DUF1697 domain-containing protein [Holophagaceae bacterium]|nr:DUF1697 domain-containing protein [Holophagaceae bacterium]
MSRYILLLRGVNVGKGNRLPMAGLRNLLELRGFTDIATILNSGNAIFSADAGSVDDLADLISADISNTFGMNIHAHVVAAGQFRNIISENDLLPVASDFSRLLVIFARKSSAITTLAESEQLLMPEECFSIGKNAAYLYCPKGISESRFATAMLGKYGKSLTTRNWKTVLRITALL